MKKSTLLLLVLSIACIFSLASCDKETNNTTHTTAVTTLSVKHTEKTKITEKPITSADPTGTAQTAEPTEAPSTTLEPTEDSTAEPTEAPVTTAPPEDTTKAPVTTAPIEDPSVDYSEWGNYGFESLLPAPLPFNTEWLSRNYAENSYGIMSANPFKISEKEKNIKILEDYVKSLEAYGYTFMPESYSFLAFNEYGTTFEFSYRDHYVCVSFTLVA